VSGKYLRLCALSFFGLLALYYIGTFVDLSEKLFKGQATTGLLLAYLWYSTPQFISYVIPMAALIGVLGTIGGLTRTSELTVMRACGVSLYRVAVPLLALAIGWSGMLFLLEERVTAPANKKAEELSDAIHGRTGPTIVVGNRNWLAGQDGRIYYYVAYQRRQQELFSVSVFDTAMDPYRLVGHTFAARAVAEGGPSGSWRASNGWVQRFSTPTRSVRDSFAVRRLALASPADFGAEPEDADAMTVGELRSYINRLSASGFTVTDERVNLHKKIAYPLVTLIMTVLGVPFAVTTGRRGALYGIGLAIAVAIGYWLISAVSLAMGAAGVLPAPLAAWAPNIVFLAAAMYLTLTVRT
jgi:LPS export ABC transporter permease LptG